MPYHCCVTQCVSNSGKPGDDAVTFHSFPDHKDLRKRWIANIHRDVGAAFTITKHTKVCSRHFADEVYHAGAHKRPSEQKKSQQTRRRLLPTAVPTIFDFRPEVTTSNSPSPDAQKKDLFH
eukprot:scpid111064/ scgid22430/ 